jgi:hypothetical protein
MAAAVYGVSRKLLLHFRHTCHPWVEEVAPLRHPPEIAPAFPAYRPSMAIKKSPACAGLFHVA